MLTTAHALIAVLRCLARGAWGLALWLSLLVACQGNEPTPSPEDGGISDLVHGEEPGHDGGTLPSDSGAASADSQGPGERDAGACHDLGGVGDLGAPGDEDVRPPPDQGAAGPGDASVPSGGDAASHPEPDLSRGPDAQLHEPPRGLWCAAQWPYHTLTVAGRRTELLFARFRAEDLAPEALAASGVVLQIGHGPREQPPRHGSWSWLAAEPNPACMGCEHELEAMVRVLPDLAGSFIWSARLRLGGRTLMHCDRADHGRLGSADGWSAQDAPTLEVSEPGSLRVVTINLRCLLDGWDSRLPILAAELAAIDPDLVGLQEVCTEPGARDNLEELAAELVQRTGRDYSIELAVTHRSWERYQEGIAVLTPHRIARSRVVDLPRGLFPRKLVLARVITPQGPLVMATTHLDHQDAGARGRQARAAVEALAGFLQPGDAAVLTGDLNEGPGGEVQEALEGSGHVDLWAALHPADAGPTFPSEQPRSRIDYVWLLLGGSGLSPEHIERIFDHPVDGTYASDHLGLSARIGP